MTTKRLALVVGLLVGLMALGLAYSRWSHGQREHARTLNAELARLRAQVGQLASAQEKAGAASMLRDAAAELRSAAVSQAANAQNVEGSKKAGQADPVPTPDQLAERQKQYNLERIRVISAQLDEQLRTDGHDHAWSHTIRPVATTVIESSV